MLSVLKRSYSEAGWSNPEKVLKAVLFNLREKERKSVSYQTLLNWIMDYFEEEQITTNNRSKAKNLWDILKMICEEKLEFNLVDPVEDMENDCLKILQNLEGESELDNIVKDIPKIINKREITYSEKFDKICFIFDRDPESFVSHANNDQYGRVLKTCREHGFGFYLTNPCFEFWLLLHYDEVREWHESDFIEKSAESLLKKMVPGYKKSRYKVDEFIERIDKAIENERHFCEDEEKLEFQVGSRVGILIEEMRKG